MLIKCPNCNTSYNVPGERIGAKPVKMRCHNCRQVFTVTRKSEAPPRGYEEYAGRDDALPNDFTFLREAQNGNLNAGSTAKTDFVAKYPIEQDPNEGHTVVGVPPAAQKVPSPPAFSPTDKDNDTTRPVPRPSPQSGSFEIYDSRRSAWENAVPLELEDYAAKTAPAKPDNALLFGKLMTLIVGTLLLFFIFVGYRNGWSLAFSNLPEQIGAAFSAHLQDDRPEPVRSLEPIVTDKEPLTTQDGSEFVVISGRVFNNADDARTKVVLRAAFRDTKGELLSRFEAPCGQTVDKKNLASIPASQWRNLYEPDGKPVHCDIGPKSSAGFELPLLKPLSGCEHGSCEVEITAVFAEIL